MLAYIQVMHYLCSVDDDDVEFGFSIKSTVRYGINANVGDT